MRKVSNKKAIQVAIVGSLIVAIVLVAGTILMGRMASRDTESAVRNVSLFYLEELAERRKQVVTAVLDNYLSDMDVAIELMEREDVSSIESLQDYQARMKQLYGIDTFAFVDDEGTIYTSRGTRTNIDEYSFDYKNLTKASISVKNTDESDKKIVVAVPVDRVDLKNRKLLVCFMEVGMDRFLDDISLQSGINSTTYCNIYTSDGKAFNNIVLGGLVQGNDLGDALKQATFLEGYDLETIRNDFKNGVSGVTSFTLNGVTGTFYYVPIERADWMVTYFIRDSIISEQIKTISDGIVRRGFMQSLITAVVLAVMFTVMLHQTRRASALAFEAETNEMQQQELEERIALQDELLDQEKARAQQDKMITALASDYRSVYYVNLDTGDSICYRNDEKLDHDMTEGSEFKFYDVFYDYAMKYVDVNYREAFLEFINADNIRKALSSEPIIGFRYLIKRDGEESYEMLRMAGVRHIEDREDGIIHAIGVGFTDIDAQMRDSLAKNQALSDALKTAEEASRAKTAFLSNMSHEIRTPMNAIIGLDSLALNEPDLTDAIRDYLEKIGSSAQHLLSLINDILDMSRIESGRMVIKNEEFAFSKLMEQVNIIFSGQCKDKGLDYDCHIKNELNDYYIGDSTKIRQILINILGNAVKFTDPGGRVDFSVENVAQFGGQSTIKFVISDTGIGMNKEFIPKLFEAFSQEDAGSTNKYGSSGLGMAITKSIVEMMNGNITVDSEKGKGTTFNVILTLQNSERKKEDDTGDSIEIRPQDINVLVIDDDPVACEHAKLVLNKEGIATETVTSGKDAIEMIKVRNARQKPYDLIVVDWQMPEMDGVETSRQIRSMVGEDSAIIILTAYNWDDIHEEAKEAGVDSFIAKPLFSGALIDEFKNALKKKHEDDVAAVKKADLNGRRVLLAEDMAVNAQIMIKVLKMRNISADHAENGKIAVDMFRDHEEGYYDAVLMDMRMPEMDGLEATKAIRSMDRADAKIIPIIALTANAFDEDVQRSLQAGLNAHLSKPVQPDVLFDTLENMIKD